MEPLEAAGTGWTAPGISCKVLITYKDFGPGGRVLSFLDALCAALIARDVDRINVLLRHPLARALPRRVRAEAMTIARDQGGRMRAPVQTLRHYHQTAHLLGATADPAVRRTPRGGTHAALPRRQLEMPLEPVLAT